MHDRNRLRLRSNESMKKTFENKKLNKIPWTVVGIVGVALIAAITVIVSGLGIWQAGVASAIALLLS